MKHFFSFLLLISLNFPVNCLEKVFKIRQKIYESQSNKVYQSDKSDSEVKDDSNSDTPDTDSDEEINNENQCKRCCCQCIANFLAIFDKNK
jgi:hypothetical protein